jgi:anti-sigma factor RsiW
MLTCKEQVARSSDYLDGQLSFRERLMVRHHLMFCRNCRRFIRQMRLMQATLRKMPEPPVAGADELAGRLAAERRKNSP